ncbi:MFS general substrate transporter [Amniculicola lignicola CBS 123094]|uniref:MFS general substrate transporter n=1 Tax=Amniculicola lignicola CBS 123094 TaxID=1392246 RepID=A0A6A5WZA2_9PLEO|nr:MFS general substrate transporter [Amniculicola lignicola CBS 123094]
MDRSIAKHLFLPLARPSSARTTDSTRTTSTTDSTSSDAIKKYVLKLYGNTIRSFVADHSPPAGASRVSFINGLIVIEEKHKEVKDPNIVDWDGESDPQKPLNWPKWKKALNLTIIFLICLVTPFASSAIAPAAPDMQILQQNFDPYLASFVTSSYVLGYAIGPLIIGPLSEVYGRVVMYNMCNIIFVLFTVLSPIDKDLKAITGFRFLAGCGGASAFTLAPASISDMVSPERRGSAFAVMGIAYNLGPAIAPMVGSYVNATYGWEWIFWIITILGGVCTFASLAGLCETYEVVLLRRKAAMLRKSAGNKELRSKFDNSTDMSHWITVRTAMLRPLRMLCFSPNILLISLVTALGFGYMYLLYTMLPLVFITVYRWEARNTGLAYLGILFGNMLAMILGNGVSNHIASKRRANGDNRPEVRLIPMIFHWPLVSIGLFVFGWSASYGIYWFVPILGTAIFGVGVMSTVFFCGTYIIDAYTLHSASATAATIVLRSLFGGLVPLFSNKLYDNLGISWANTLLAAIALAFAPIPFFFYKYGQGLRAKYVVLD